MRNWAESSGGTSQVVLRGRGVSHRSIVYISENCFTIPIPSNLRFRHATAIPKFRTVTTRKAHKLVTRVSVLPHLGPQGPPLGPPVDYLRRVVTVVLLLGLPRSQRIQPNILPIHQ
jgi:hypothetical protein